MENVLVGVDRALIYLDVDVLIVGDTFEETLALLIAVFKRISDAGLKFKLKKCSLFKRETEFLGFVVGRDGIKPSSKKISAVQSRLPPEKLTDLRRFLGFCSYYHRLVAEFATVAAPLYALTKKETKFVWTENCQNAFDELKRRLTTAPVLAYPDFRYPFIIETDASLVGIGAVLSQEIDNVR